MPRKIVTRADQITLFGLDPIPTQDELHESVRVVTKKPKVKKPTSFHRPNGMVMCRVYSDRGIEWKELPETDEVARHFVGLCRADPKYLKGAEWAYRIYLDTKDKPAVIPPKLDYYSIWRKKQEEGMVELCLF